MFEAVSTNFFWLFCMLAITATVTVSPMESSVEKRVIVRTVKIALNLKMKERLQ